MLTPRVLKFGGSSVADAACMRQVAALVRAALPAAPLVVLSAMGKTTDALVAASQAALRGDLAGGLERIRGIAGAHRDAAADLFEGRPTPALAGALAEAFERLELLLRGVALLRELTPRTADAIAAHGEFLSTRIFAEWLRVQGVEASWIDARRVLRTDATFGEAQPLGERIAELTTEHLAPLLGPGRVVVTQGYVGATEDGLTTTLGRGGSDYSAALFGAALGASEVQIWTDVEGILTCDPRVVPNALPVPELAFDEAAELAAFGAKVLHPSTLQPAVEAGVPVTVRHTLKPTGRFTTITGQVSSGRPVTALAGRGPITVLTVTSLRMLAQSGFLARLFEVFARLTVSVDLIATAEVSVSLTVEPEAPIAELRRELSAFARVDVHEERSIVAVVGERLKRTPGLAARIFGALDGINVEMISMGANEINLSLVVRDAERCETLRRLHRALFESAGGAA